jgi:hypothetical protein
VTSTLAHTPLTSSSSSNRPFLCRTLYKVTYQIYLIYLYKYGDGASFDNCQLVKIYHRFLIVFRCPPINSSPPSSISFFRLPKFDRTWSIQCNLGHRNGLLQFYFLIQAIWRNPFGGHFLHMSETFHFFLLYSDNVTHSVLYSLTVCYHIPSWNVVCTSQKLLFGCLNTLFSKPSVCVPPSKWETDQASHPYSTVLYISIFRFLYEMGYQELFPLGQSGRCLKLITHLHLVPRSRIRGAIPPFPDTPSWRGVHLKKARVQITFTFWLIVNCSPN